MNSHTCLAILTCVLLFSCNAKKLAPGQYNAYVEDKDHGLYKATVVNDISYGFQYKPYDYMLLNERIQDENTRAERLKQLKGTVWFNIKLHNEQCKNTSILKCNVNDVQEYQNRLSYFLNDAQRDIHVLYDHSTELRQTAYLFEPHFDLSPEETLVIGYELPAGDSIPVKDITISFDDRLFKNGIMKATFSKETLSDLPQLSTNN